MGSESPSTDSPPGGGGAPNIQEPGPGTRALGRGGRLSVDPDRVKAGVPRGGPWSLGHRAAEGRQGAEYAREVRVEGDAPAISKAIRA